MEWIQEIKRLVRDGLYVRNLELIVAAASRGLEAGTFIIPAFVMLETANSIISLWDSGPVRVSDHSAVEDAVRPAFDALVDAMLTNAAQSDVTASVERLIVAWYRFKLN